MLRRILLPPGKPVLVWAGINAGARMEGIGLAEKFGRQERHLHDLLRRVIRPGDVVLDVGANVGYVTLAMSRLAAQDGLVCALEPVPPTFDILERNVSRNGRGNVSLLRKAASDGEATVRMRVPVGFESMASRYWHRDLPDAREFDVETVLVDRLPVLQNRAVRFAKIDVEGAEGDVIGGMEGIIARCRPILYVECSEMGRERSWSIMKKHGYRCFSATCRQEVVRFEQYRHADFIWTPPGAECLASGD